MSTTERMELLGIFMAWLFGSILLCWAADKLERYIKKAARLQSQTRRHLPKRANENIYTPIIRGRKKVVK